MSYPGYEWGWLVASVSAHPIATLGIPSQNGEGAFSVDIGDDHYIGYAVTDNEARNASIWLAAYDLGAQRILGQCRTPR